MTERERRVNLQLSALDDAHRLGRIARDEYRRRRRCLLAAPDDETCATARDTVRRPASAGQPGDPAGSARRASRRRRRVLSLGVFGAICVGLALFYWLMLRTV
ncbi:hypothetical protein [Paraburkholderia rhizosphaerae]|uniref:Uncharacterized protein n=1 Tax=Paraburkholderia rhizosphaerae TaxID=480658 RepID=A0A4R8LX36_9BURK|nr:hypothetical protein [Paraburkholderia rhizosphaerae]TDY52746.1 hypothetical protein BX592_10428 [Paraburkholderia rhizosphaerae]